MISDSWASAGSYDSFMGRWSRVLAQHFLSWLNPEAGLSWLDLGCGTGALTATILERATPASILACDPSGPLLALARERIRDSRVTFQVGRAGDLTIAAGSLDAFVSGLVLNFIDDPRGAVELVADRMTPGGLVGAYVWDYAGDMELLRVFWDVAGELDPGAVDQHEGRRFPLCAPESLRALFQAAGLQDVRVAPLEITAGFDSFASYWLPFLGATGPAPSYVNALSPEQRGRLEDALRAEIAPAGGEGFTLRARAWAVRGRTRQAGIS